MLKKPDEPEADEFRAKHKKFLELRNINADFVLFLHEEAEEYPKGSEERLAALELAHRVYLDGRRKRRGKPKNEGEDAIDHDAAILGIMEVISSRTGETSPRALARAVIKHGLVPKVGSEKSRIERLARKYGRLKRGEIVIVRHFVPDAYGCVDDYHLDLLLASVVGRKAAQTK